MPAIVLVIIVFVTVVAVVFAFGAALVTPSSVLGARLRALGTQPVQAREKPAVKVKERIEQALDPLSKAIPLSPADVSRTRAWLIQAGLREPRHASYYFGIRLLLAFVALVVMIVSPWGEVLAEGDGRSETVVFGRLDAAEIKKARIALPGISAG